jgi:hypothetical protein
MQPAAIMMHHTRDKTRERRHCNERLQRASVLPVRSGRVEICIRKNRTAIIRQADFSLGRRTALATGTP